MIVRRSFDSGLDWFDLNADPSPSQIQHQMLQPDSVESSVLSSIRLAWKFLFGRKP